MVQGNWDDPGFFAGLMATSEQIQKLQQGVTKANFLTRPIAKIRLGKQVFEERQRAREVVVRDVVAHLSALSAAIKLESLHGDQCFNVSFLVARDDESAFDKLVQDFGDECPQWVTLKYIGPLSLNSFLHLNLKTTDFEEIDRARQLLELPSKATHKEIQQAYRQQAALHHPDKHQATNPELLQEHTQQMQVLIAAKEFLMKRCRQRRRSSDRSVPVEWL
ncbi:MAG: DnaJ domain-containing protein [Proteobacteria bacterium]|nr:DnaJ domain-containing protein [Pseudomonadota bacterium]